MCIARRYYWSLLNAESSEPGRLQVRFLCLWFPYRLLKTVNLSRDPQQQAHIRAFGTQRRVVWNRSWVSARGFQNTCRTGWPWHSFGQVRHTSEVQKDSELHGRLASYPGLMWELCSSSEVDPEVDWGENPQGTVLTSPPSRFMHELGMLFCGKQTLWLVGSFGFVFFLWRVLANFVYLFCIWFVFVVVLLGSSSVPFLRRAGLKVSPYFSSQ